jgi:hypothetical protein
MMTDESDETAVEQMKEALTIELKDDPIVRWVALMSLEGYSVKEIRQRLLDERLITNQMSENQIIEICAKALTAKKDMKGLVHAKAELTDSTWLRLDSYMRRKRVIDMMEHICSKALGDAQSVSQLNQVNFMLAGLIKAQESMDTFSGAKAPPVSVVAHVQIDPLEQMRRVVQEEVRKGRQIIDVEVVEDDSDDE